ncbi:MULTISPECIES: hypothetical protein [Luteibacter]|uniref:hypothetical protein n=1 Tax=Luteibacter sp. dw_328 TaxID=2719796 RepID=UPI0007BF6AA4|nr:MULTISPECIES: hypothetical protein [Luteibacter]
MPEKVNLHDANVESVEIDAINRIFRIRIDRYVSDDSRERVQSTVEFKNVQSFSGTLNLMELVSHARFGNVADWEPSMGFGLSYLYFAGGVFSVHSDEPVIF